MTHLSMILAQTSGASAEYNTSPNIFILKGLEMSNEKKEKQPEWISVKEAAEIMDIHIESVRRLCRKNIIKSRQFAPNAHWEVWREDAENYKKDDFVGGRGKSHTPNN